MRGLAVAVVALGVMAQCAQAADLAFLRGALSDGPRRHVNWEGFYVGGQASYGWSTINFKGANDTIASDLFPYSSVKTFDLVPELGKETTSGSGYGGFVGYNWQWTDVVLGLEANYIHGNLDASSMPVPYRSAVNVIRSMSSAALQMKDYGSVRARAGYSGGAFLPYAFGGFAIGRANTQQSVSLVGNFDPLVTQEVNQTDRVIYGYSAGAGVDVMLMAGLFMRAEYEYQRLTSAQIDININTVRGGLGYKF